MLAILTAAFSSPTALITVAGLPIALISMWWLHQQTRRPPWLWLGLVAGTSAIIFAVYRLTNHGSYHYSDSEGWTDYSLAVVVDNLVSAFTYLMNVYNTNTTNMFIMIGGLLMVAAVALYNWWQGSTATSPSKSLIFISLNALVLSALAFGPASITTNMVSRYLVMPTTLGLLALTAFILYVYRHPLSGWRYSVILLAISVVIAGNLLQRNYMVDRFYLSRLESHQAISELIVRESDMWPEDAQLVLLTHVNHPSTVGLNHWSTWYLRMMTGHWNIIGLVGPPSMITRDPFVDEYHDHAEEYWAINDGRRERISMMGLERQRPLFVYAQDSDGLFRAYDYVVFADQSSSDLIPVGFGQTYEDVTGGSLQAICLADGGPSNMFLWLAGSKFESHFDRQDGDHLTLEFNGEEIVELSVDIPVGANFRVGMTLSDFSPVGDVYYDDTTPPMPGMTSAFALYHLANTVMISDRAVTQRWFVPENDGHVDIFFEGIDGCVVLVGTGDNVLGVLSSHSISDTWILGNGFNNRYWTGTIDNFYIAIDP